MRPPNCDLCGEDFAPSDGDLLTFAPTEASRAWRVRAEEEEGFVGHPPDAGWFCSLHVARARDLTHETLGEALRILKLELG